MTRSSFLFVQTGFLDAVQFILKIGLKIFVHNIECLEYFSECKNNKIAEELSGEF